MAHGGVTSKQRHMGEAISRHYPLSPAHAGNGATLRGNSAATGLLGCPQLGRFPRDARPDETDIADIARPMPKTKPPGECPGGLDNSILQPLR
jgi:hypothetical protein